MLGRVFNPIFIIIASIALGFFLGEWHGDVRAKPKIESWYNVASVWEYEAWDRAAIIRTLEATEKRQKSVIEARQVEARVLESKIGELNAEISILKARPEGYQKWQSLGELRGWLEANPINEREYINQEYDCDDFAIDLALAAMEDGKFIGLRATKIHMANWAIVGNLILAIEPQNDGYIQWTTKRWTKVD